MDLPDTIALRFARRSADVDLPLDALSADERTAVADFGSNKRQREYALGRTVVRGLLAERLGMQDAAVPLRIAADGAPEVDDDGVHVSLSHVATETQTLAAAVLASHPVGVDLELIRPRRPDLYRFLLAPEDYGLLDTLPHSHDEAQVLIWTLKEAVLKGLRTGFRLSPKRLRLAVAPDEGRASVRLGDGQGWALRYVQREGCFLAVAFPAHRATGDMRTA